MKPARKILAALGLLALTTMLPVTALAQDQDSPTTVDISPVYQQTPEWCWAAVGQMVFEYYDIPAVNTDLQCGIVALYGARTNAFGQLYGPCMSGYMGCAACVIGAGQFATIGNMLSQYPVIAAAFNHQAPHPISSLLVDHALSKDQVTDEIDAQHPVIAGVSPDGPTPGGEAEHVVLIVGYDDSDSDHFYLIVNDPFPIGEGAFVNMPNPYLIAGGEKVDDGQYRIEYSAFKNRLRWTRSAYHIQK